MAAATHGQHPEGHPAPGTPSPAPALPPQSEPAAPRFDHAAHDKHAGHSVAMFRDRFWLSLLLTLPTLVFGHMLPKAMGYETSRLSGAHLVAPVFGTLVFVFGGRVFLHGGLRELRARKPGMMTLVALAITVAFAFSVAVALGFKGVALWEELATLVTIMLLGHWIEMRSILQASGALRELAKLLPTRAVRIRGATEEDVPISDLSIGDLTLVRPGGSIPADGVVHDGKSSVNESMITGESLPANKEPGARVIGGTINGAGSLRVVVTRTGEHTALARITRLVALAQASRSGAQALADRAASYLTLIALVTGMTTLSVWLLIRRDDPAWAVERAVTVLVIACPHALGLAIPLVTAISTTLGARNGLLVRDYRALEEARLVDTVVFDKTGTLTRGRIGVIEMITDGISEAEALGLAAAIERDSEHPMAKGIVRSAAERQVPVPVATGFVSLPGRGVKAKVQDDWWFVGGPALLEEQSLEPNGARLQLLQRATADGHAVIYLTDGKAVRAAFAVADEIRAESREAVARLRAQGISVVLLSGDARAVAESVGRELGIERVMAQVLPEEKAAVIETLKASGKRVAMVGDGVNDAPALATADVGIAIGAGTEVAVEAGDAVLIRSDPRDVPKLIALSRATWRKMTQNLWWAAGYNIVAIPLAAGVLSSRGVVLSPAAGAVLMSLSTIMVALNSQTLRRLKLE